MSQPEPPPATVGLVPQTALEVNSLIGSHLRQFTDIKETITHDQDWLVTVDLKAAPYYLSEDQETLIKSAIADLDTHLDATNMTFISRLTGPF
jgi:predicted transcriptional regulator